MSRSILIQTSEVELVGELDGSETARAIWDALPVEGSAHRWGQEIYFPIPVDLDLETGARQEMKVGELAYWPGGSAFCIFFGPTPVSRGEEPRAYSEVNPFGQILGDLAPLREIKDGEAITVARAED
jgi:hypothetical protein